MGWNCARSAAMAARRRGNGSRTAAPRRYSRRTRHALRTTKPRAAPGGAVLVVIVLRRLGGSVVARKPPGGWACVTLRLPLRRCRRAMRDGSAASDRGGRQQPRPRPPALLRGRGYAVDIVPISLRVTRLRRQGPGFRRGGSQARRRIRAGMREALHAHDPAIRIVVIHGLRSIASAFEAIKLGAEPLSAQARQHRRHRISPSRVSRAMCRCSCRADRPRSVPRMGAHPRDVVEIRLQHLRDRPPARHCTAGRSPGSSRSDR